MEKKIGIPFALAEDIWNNVIPENLSEAWFQSSFPKWPPEAPALVFELCYGGFVRTDQDLSGLSLKELEENIKIPFKLAKDIDNKFHADKPQAQAQTQGKSIACSIFSSPR